MSAIITIAEAANRLAEAKNFDANYYAVIVNNGGGTQPKPKLATKKEQISIRKCKEIVANLQAQFPDIEIKKIEILMYDWDYTGITPEGYINIIYGDCGLPFNPRKSKTAKYWVKENRLMIYDINGYPIYENYNGDICNDPVALADSLLD